MESAERVRNRIATAFASSGLSPEVVDGIAFHMTDWKQDLEELVRLYEKSDLLADDEVRKILIRFLAHVPNHVAAAKKLTGLGPVEDVFGAGVLREDA